MGEVGDVDATLSVDIGHIHVRGRRTTRESVVISTVMEKDRTSPI